MHKTQRRRVFLAVGILCCFMLELVSGPRLHGPALSPAGQQKETGFFLQKSNLFCQYTLIDETGHQVSSPLTSQAKNHLKYFSLSEFLETVKNRVVESYPARHPELSPTFTNTVIIFPFHYFW